MLSKSTKLFLVIYGAIVLAMIWAITLDHDAPAFKPGDCIQIKSQPENWERPYPIKHIDEIGRESYRVDGDDTVPFSFQNVYQKVACPEAFHAQ